MPKAKVKTGIRRHRAKMSRCEDLPEADDYRQPDDVTGVDHISHLSLELLERIFDYLPLRTIISCERLNRHFQMAVQTYLKVMKCVDLTENQWHGSVPESFTLPAMAKFLRQCPQLEVIRGLHYHPDLEDYHCSLDGDAFLIEAIVKELKRCRNLRQVEVSSLILVETLMREMPELELGCFANRGEFYESETRGYFHLNPGYRITKLHLTGVVLSELPETPHLQEVILEWVDLTSSQPFQNFICPALRTFVMRNCFGPLNALKYVALIDNLARCAQLERLELVRVPFLGGLIQHRVEETAQECTNGFHNLKSIIVSGCKNCTEQDLGYLLVAASRSLESLSLQPCLTKDSLFLALRAVEVKFFNLRTLCLGYVDPWANSGKYTPSELASDGLAEITENPALLTDMGMKAMAQVFPNIATLTVHNCPHLRYPRGWLDVEPVDTCWSQLTSLHLRHCHGVQLHDAQSLPHFLEWLPSLEDIHLERMFPKPPKGCSRVGLSAGTGIGVSSALVAMQNPGAQHGNAQQPPQNQAEVQVPNVPAPAQQNVQRHQDDAEREGALALPGNRQVQQAEVQVPNVERHRENVDRDAIDQGPQSHGENADGDVAMNLTRNPQDQEDDMQDPERSLDIALRKGIPEAPHTASDQSPDHQETEEEAMDHQCADSANADVCAEGSSISEKQPLTHSSSVTKDTVSVTDPVENTVAKIEPSPEYRDSMVGTAEGCELATTSRQSIDHPIYATADTRIVPRHAESVSSGTRRPDQTTPKRNVRDAATSAVAIRPPCPIHGTLVQSGREDNEESSPSSSPTKQQRTGCDEIDSQDVGVEVRQDDGTSDDAQRPQMCDQATSTSDPVMEPDPVLVFKCTSQSVRSVTFDECGISHIDMQGCPNLKSIQGHNLPIFKQLRLSGQSSNVTRLQFEQCPKMHLADAMQQLMSCHPADRFLRFRPMYRSAISELESALVSQISSLDCHLLFIVDRISPPQAHHGTALQDWMHLLSRLNQELILSGTLHGAGRKVEEDGEEEPGMRTPVLETVVDAQLLKLVTDIPWLETLLLTGRFLMGKPPLFNADIEVTLSKLKKHLAEDISMATSQQTPVFPHIFCVYVQTCDEDGAAVPGEFMSYYN